MWTRFFELVKAIRTAAGKVGERHNLDIGWLNFVVKMFVIEHQKKVLFDFPNLKVFVPDGDYMLAMKVLSARPDSSDLEDIEFLLDHLQMRNLEDIVDVVQNYYPRKEIKGETIFLLEALLEK